MSGRIRSIKPEWLEDEHMVMASASARVLSVALLLLADDYGNGRAARHLLATRVFPNEPEALKPALEELVRCNFVVLYEAKGQAYFSIRNWKKHQRVDKPGKPLVPAPDDGVVQPSPGVPNRDRVAYFIRSPATGLVKIGASVDPIARLAELSLQSPEPLELLAIGGDETNLHRELADSRVHGEWFRPSPAVLEKIRENGGNPDSPIATAGYDGKKRVVEKIRDIPAKIPEDPAPDLDLDLDHDPDLSLGTGRESEEREIPKYQPVERPLRNSAPWPLSDEPEAAPAKPKYSFVADLAKRVSAARNDAFMPTGKELTVIESLKLKLAASSEKREEPEHELGPRVLDGFMADQYAAATCFSVWHLEKHWSRYVEPPVAPERAAEVAQQRERQRIQEARNRSRAEAARRLGTIPIKLLGGDS